MQAAKESPTVGAPEVILRFDGSWRLQKCNIDATLRVLEYLLFTMKTTLSLDLGRSIL
jgi:hypothetical protein